MSKYSIVLEYVDLVRLTVIAMVVLSLIKSNGRLRPLIGMFVAIGAEIGFVLLSRFFPDSWTFVVLRCCGGLIEIVAIFLYLYKPRVVAVAAEVLSGDRSVGEWEERIRLIVREEVAAK